MKPIVYIVEDDQALSIIYTEAFLKVGFEPIAMRNGQDALIALQNVEKMPQAILLDLHVPDVSGAEILAYVRSQPEFDLVKVAVISADAVLLRSPEIEKMANFTELKPLRFAKLLEIANSLKQPA